MSIATPISPPTGPATGSSNGLHPKSNFLAFKTNPQLALALTVLLAALAGVPLTAGFIGKFFVFLLAVNAHLWWAVGIAIIAAAAGFYYYFKVIRAVWWMPPPNDTPLTLPPISKACVALLTLAVLVFGIWPQPIWALLSQ